jgi:hypothetical protein
LTCHITHAVMPHSTNKRFKSEKITQNDINIALYEELLKLDSKLNCSIDIQQISVAMATVITMFAIVKYTISLLTKVIQ